jgi:hypothetical protein
MAIPVRLIADALPLFAALLAVPQFLPQLLKLVKSGDRAGLSRWWAALTSINNAGWFYYFASFHIWTALIPAASAVVFAGILAVLLGRATLMSPLALAGLIAWAAILAATTLVVGRDGLGTALTAASLLQVAPSLRVAYATRRPTGISRPTWSLVLGELLCWGLFGVYRGDPRLIALGCIGTIASVLMICRATFAVKSSRAEEAAARLIPNSNSGALGR